jgi:hypothetical protein
MVETSQNPKIIETPGYQGFYLERPGVSARVLVEKLTQTPERPLSENDQLLAEQFEHDLADTIPQGADRTIIEIIENIKEESTTAPTVFAGPFLSGQIDKSMTDGKQFETPKEVYDWFAEQVKLGNNERLTVLARESRKLFTAQVADVIKNDGNLDEEQQSMRQIVAKPKEAIKNSSELLSAREFLLNEWKKHSDKDDDLSAAEKAFIEIYLARINALIANQVPVMTYLINQSAAIDDEDTEREALEAIPKGLREAATGENRQKLFRRLDFLRNGIGERKGDRSSSLARQVIASVMEGQVLDPPDAPMLSPEQIVKMRQIKLTPEQMKTHIENIIRNAGLLSSEKPSNPNQIENRSERASDGLIQVIISPSKLSFSYDSIAGLYKVSSQPRTLWDAVVVGGFHELTHINQGEANRTLGERFRIFRPRGKRVSLLVEAGANSTQRLAEMKLSGHAKPFALTYANALEKLESGGSYLDAAKAFYKEKRRVVPEVSQDDAAKGAADGVLRLVGMGGINSQPLAYAEAAILKQELSGLDSEDKERAYAITGLDLVDQVRLHQFGLLSIPGQKPIDWTKLVLEEFHDLIGSITEEAETPTGK